MPGKGNFYLDPLFANPGYWAHPDDPSIPLTPYDPEHLFTHWVEGDYHLMSSQGRWDGLGWVVVADSSPCIDAGDPDYSPSDEHKPNGDKINIGAYGGANQASISVP